MRHCGFRSAILIDPSKIGHLLEADVGDFRGLSRGPSARGSVDTPFRLFDLEKKKRKNHKLTKRIVNQ
jgi:hypothetical protein